MPVIKVMERKITEKASPALNTFSHVFGIQVSMETMNAPRRMYQAMWMIRSICGARMAAVVGGVGGSMEARGSVDSPSLRSPGTTRSATTSTMKGRDETRPPTTHCSGAGTPAGRCSATPMRKPTAAAMGMERRTAQAAAAKAATTSVA